MKTQSVTKPDRAQSLDQDIHRLRQQLDALKKHLMHEPSAEILNEFDGVTEDMLAEVFGSSSPLLDTYEYAEVESAIADLEARRASLAKEAKKRKTTGPRVSDFMASTVRKISLDATLREAGQCLQKWKIGSLLVQSGDEYIGSISETELTSEVVASGTDATTTTVTTCMREPLVIIETSDPIVEAVRLMKEKGTRHLAVTESGRIVGVVSVSDVIRYYSGVV